MQTYRIEKFGRIDGLARRTEPTPVPGPRQILVRIRANALNYRDLNVLQGVYRTTPRPDVIPLSDGAGEVTAVGPEVTRFRIGDRVCGIFFQRWLGGRVEAEHLVSDLGGSLDGMLTEYKVLDEAGAVRIPDHLSFEEAATLPCAAVTAWVALTRFARVLPGQTVLAMGTGGVAVFALQLARILGARVIATTSSAAKAQRLTDLGADATVDYSVTPDWEQEVKRLTHGRGVDLVVDVGGAQTIHRAVSSTALGGTVVLVGRLGGSGPGLDLNLLRGRSIGVHATSVGSRQDFEDMNRALAAHRVRPVIDRVFAFEDAASAYEHLASKRHFGKVVIAGA